MIADGMRRTLERLVQEYSDELGRRSLTRSLRTEEQEVAVAEEHFWINKAFLFDPMDQDVECERHPQSYRRYIKRLVREHQASYHGTMADLMIGEWAAEQTPKKHGENELHAGDTAELDSFLAGFSHEKK